MRGVRGAPPVPTAPLVRRATGICDQASRIRAVPCPAGYPGGSESIRASGQHIRTHHSGTRLQARRNSSPRHSHRPAGGASLLSPPAPSLRRRRFSRRAYPLSPRAPAFRPPVSPRPRLRQCRLPRRVPAPVSPRPRLRQCRLPRRAPSPCHFPHRACASAASRAACRPLSLPTTAPAPVPPPAPRAGPCHFPHRACASAASRASRRPLSLPATAPAPVPPPAPRAYPLSLPAPLLHLEGEYGN